MKCLFYLKLFFLFFIKIKVSRLDNKEEGDTFAIQEDQIELHEDRLSLALDDTRTAETNLSVRENLGIANYVLIESRDVLSLNVTPSAYKVIMYLTQITAGSDKKEVLETKNKPALKFLNFLGEKCSLTVSSKTFLKAENAVGFDLNVHTSNHTTDVFNVSNTADVSEDVISKNNTIASNELIRKLVFNSQCPQIDAVYDDGYKFTLKIDNFEECKFSLKTDGSYLITLREPRRESVPG